VAPGGTVVCTGSYTVTQADLDKGSVLNTACADSDQTPEKCDDLTITGEKKPAFTIEKTSPDTTFSTVGDVLDYTVTFTNTGNVTLSGVVVTDELLDVALANWQCTPAGPASVAPGGTVVCTGSYTVTQADLDKGSVLNTACADSDQTPEKCDDVDIPGTRSLSLTVDKTADKAIVDIKGEQVTFTYTVTNTSNVTAAIDSLADDRFGTLAGDPDCQVGTLLAPGASCTFEATFLVKPDKVADPPQDTPPHVNVFTACLVSGSGDGPTSIQPALGPVCDDDPATVGFISGKGRTPDPSPKPTQPPTDMLVASPGSTGGPLDGTTSWILWIALSSTLIVVGGWVLRRQRFAEA
jgi:uncharacterized repeat protein (TIGR01451 family)